MFTGFWPLTTRIDFVAHKRYPPQRVLEGSHSIVSPPPYLAPTIPRPIRDRLLYVRALSHVPRIFVPFSSTFTGSWSWGEPSTSTPTRHPGSDENVGDSWGEGRSILNASGVDDDRDHTVILSRL